MARLPRHAPPNYTYHIITRGNNKQLIFLEDQDRLKYLKILKAYKKHYRFFIYHYALMNNHVHLMGMPTTENCLSLMMKCINSSYALFYRKKYGGIGHFWQDRFKSIPVLTEAYYFKCASYIELNPLKADLTTSPQNYAWSSYRAYALGEQNSFIDIDPAYELFGKNEKEKQNNYAKFIENMNKQDFKKLEQELMNDKIQQTQRLIISKLRQHLPNF